MLDYSLKLLIYFGLVPIIGKNFLADKLNLPDKNFTAWTY